MLTRWLGLVALILVTACGSKSQIREPRARRDAGMLDARQADAPRPPDTLLVDCGRPERRVAVDRPFTIRGSVESTSPLTDQSWRVTTSPAGAAVELPEGAEGELTLATEGNYIFEFEAANESGQRGRCMVSVEAVARDVVAVCPPEAEFEAGIGMPVVLLGDAVAPMGSLSARWVQVSGPAMADLRVIGGAGTVVEFRGPATGLYTLRLEAMDTRSSDSCEVQVRVTAPPMVDCGGTLTGPTRRPITARATATDDDLAGVSWELVRAPMGSTAVLMPTNAPATTFTPNVRGEYTLRFTAIDATDQTASCEVLVIAQPSPPDAVCLETVETRPLTETAIVGSAVDDGRIVESGWRLTRPPMGSAAMPPAPMRGDRATFFPDIAGDYTLEYFARDDDGNVATCQTVVRALADEGLRVEMFWNTTGTDMDLHMLHPTATSWGDELDCHFANCIRGLAWPPDGTRNDPSLDLDNTSGLGPENINIDSPADGVYRVGVHAFRGGGEITVRVYCGGSRTTPAATFGPVRLTDESQLWRVADVDIRGVNCRVVDLAMGGRPNICTEGLRCSSR